MFCLPTTITISFIYISFSVCSCTRIPIRLRRANRFRILSVVHHLFRLKLAESDPPAFVRYLDESTQLLRSHFRVQTALRIDLDHVNVEVVVDLDVSSENVWQE